MWSREAAGVPERSLGTRTGMGHLFDWKARAGQPVVLKTNAVVNSKKKSGQTAEFTYILNAIKLRRYPDN